MLSAMDDFLIDKIFEPFSRWTQKNFGVTCFTIARHAFIVSLLTFISFSMLISPLFGTWLTFLASAATLVKVMGTIRLVRSTEKGDRDLEKLKTNNLMNSLRINLKETRTRSVLAELPLWICMGIFWSIFIPEYPLGELFLISITAEFVGYYMISCSPLPPQKSKAREWIESRKVVSEPEPASAGAG